MLSQKILSASGQGAEPLYVDDVFSTWLYTGNGSTQTIPNGIDLLGKGGMVWVKQRNGTYPHILSNTVRGLEKGLVSNSTAAEDAITNGVTFPNGSASSTGFVLGSNTESNASGQTFASWTFREAEKFFDVVTYTGTGVARTVSHNLGSVPGCIIIKNITSGSTNWVVYHVGLNNGVNPRNYGIILNLTNAQSSTAVFNNTAPTSSEFTVNTGLNVNSSGETYVAYLFAHNAGGFGATGNDNVISCGSVSMPPSGGAVTVDLGYEPQWVIAKDYRHTGGLQWFILDNMRGWPATNTANLSYNYLQANTNGAEATSNSGGWITPTGFVIPGGFNYADGNTDIIYIAIRRPHKPPTSGTQVYQAANGNSSTPPSLAGFPVDLAIANASTHYVADRLRGTNVLATNNADAEFNWGGGFPKFDNMTGYSLSTDMTGYFSWMFRRAPGFFDVVCYTGTGNGQVINHNLGAVPELAIFKLRAGTGNVDWVVRAPGTTTDRFLLLNTTNAQSTAANWYSATSTQITFPTAYAGTAQSGFTYVAYLFASLPGISQVGSYTGNGSSQTINCGFAAGARFVMIKRTDSTGDWYVWDTARGIVSGNDPRLSLNTTAAEVTTDDSLDPANSGFIVNQLSATNINVNGASYVYLSIA